MANRFEINSLVTEKGTNQTYIVTEVKKGTNGYFCRPVDPHNIKLANKDENALYIYDEVLEPYMHENDNGYMIVRLTDKTYYNGMNQFVKQARNGKIYHDLKRMMETFSYYFEKNKDSKFVDLDPSHYAICEIYIECKNITIPEMQKEVRTIEQYKCLRNFTRCGKHIKQNSLWDYSSAYPSKNGVKIYLSDTGSDDDPNTYLDIPEKIFNAYFVKVK